tara:strand:+ start:3970 stop:4257 length:288 start_codon:yes stop_codon:yes gene_type:complete
MENKIQLKHPTGKKAIRMDQGKYDLLKKAILNYLKNAGESTHREILNAIEEDFRKTKMKFEGSLKWHMEWVKLDLEARKEINRIAGSSPIKFKLV